MPYPYMISKSPWGVYNNTFRYSAAIFASRDPFAMAFKSGVVYDREKGLFRLTSLGQNLIVTYPEGRITFAGTDWSPPFPWCLCILNSLARADGTSLSGRLISYRELENGQVYYPAFEREAINRLAVWSEGKSGSLLAKVSKELGGFVQTGADFCCTLLLLPHFPLIFKIWFPDDELTGSANILFDSTANQYLHTEDIAGIGERLVTFFIKHYQLLTDI